MKFVKNPHHQITIALILLMVFIVPISGFAQECEIEDLEAEVEDCEDGFFYAEVEFDHENTGDYFQLWVNNADSGLYGYDDLPLSIGPLAADGLTPYAFEVQDEDAAGCGDLYTLDPVECETGDCNIFNMHVQPKQCYNGEFTAKIHFTHLNVGEQFQLWVNGADSGYYEYDDLPIYIGPLTADGETPHAFVVEDENSADCGTAFTLDPVTCIHECNIFNMHVQEKHCQDGEFMAKIHFTHLNVSEQFQLWVNGADSGYYDYDDLPIYVGPLAADGITPYSFIVEDENYADCGESYTLDPVLCGGDDECEIEDLEAEVEDCQDTVFFSEITFDYDEVGSMFNLWVNGADSGLFMYEDLPLYMGPFPADGITLHVFEVQDETSAGCGDIFTMDPVECESEECEIDDLEAEIEDCENGEFSAELDFDHENVSDNFQLWVNNVDSGFYGYDELPILIGPLSADGVTTHVFMIEDEASASCGDIYTLGPVSCDNGDSQSLIQNVFPVPARNKLEVSLNKKMVDKKITIEVRDMNGHLYIYEQLEGQSITSIDISSLMPGIYMIRVLEKSTSPEVRKFIIR